MIHWDIFVNILQKYLKDPFEVMLPLKAYPIIDLLHTLEIYSSPINEPPFHLLIFNTACILKCHGNSSYATNMNFGFLLTKRTARLSDGKHRKSVQSFFVKL